MLLHVGGRPESRRATLTAKLLELYQALQAAGVSGTILLDGSYISEEPEPEDFDVLIVGPADLQMRKDMEPNLASLLDAGAAEAQGCSLLPKPRQCGKSLVPFGTSPKKASLKALSNSHFETRLTVIANSTELQIALRNLRIFEETSAALQEELAEANPDLLAAALPAYLNRIARLQSEVADYLHAHPSDVSILAAVAPLELQAA